MSSTAPTTLPPRTTSLRTTTTTTSPSQTYLLAYNALSLVLWTYLLARALLAILTLSPATLLTSPTYIPSVRWTQSLALLEVIHAGTGVVRAGLATTTMQVASRLLLVWGIVYLFGEGGAGAQSGRAWDGMVAGAKGGGRAALFSGGGNAWVYAGMVLAWGVSEVVRYGYFVAVLGAGEVPAWLGWARYNAFFVLYPLGITCECLLVYAGHGLARAWEPLYAWFLVLVLAIYVPGSYILYSHMMAQRRRVMRGKARKA